jgi:hypothetical protein
MSKRTKRIIGFSILLTLALVLAACTGATQATEPAQGPAPTTAPPDAPQPVPTCPAAPACPTAEAVEPGIAAPFEEEWAASPHNDVESPAFTYWNATDDKMIPLACAKCHSTPGYIEFLGGDGSEAGKSDQPHPIGTTVTCDACHNQAAAALTTVTFPSGAEVHDLGPEARCMVCHQGRASKVQVDAQVERFAAEDPDGVVDPITQGDTTTAFGFINIHYYAAAATLYGTEAMGGYQYEGKSYDAKFDHVEGYDTCVGCHNPHTTEVKVEQCALCHEGVASVDDLKKVRMVSSIPDYDGDGNVTEGMYEEIVGLRETLLTAIMAYAVDATGTGIVYVEEAHPYFFADSDGNGEADVNDQNAPVRFTTWTPRLLKAAYNFQVAKKDPGAYAHGNKYIVQLLYDSLEDLNVRLGSIDMTAMHREDAGHFAGDTEAFRHWDAEEGNVPGACAKCHTASGLPQFLAEGANITNKASNGLLCSTCHDEANWPATYAVTNVTFPSGAQVSFGEDSAANLCLVCHQGRESTVSVNRAVAGLDANAPSDRIRFRNIHYFAAGATLFGNEVQGIYEYEGKEYAGRFAHVPNFDTCVACHDPHALEPKVESCSGCHGTDDPATIRLKLTADYDGDGDTTEGLKGEVEGMSELLYAALQNYATTTAQVGILYDSHAYPYFFVDNDGDGVADKNDAGASIGYNAFTPTSLKGAYNFQYVQKDPGAYVHNAAYVMQAMYDSIQALGGDVSNLTRP